MFQACVGLSIDMNGSFISVLMHMCHPSEESSGSHLPCESECYDAVTAYLTAHIPWESILDRVCIACLTSLHNKSPWCCAFMVKLSYSGSSTQVKPLHPKTFAIISLADSWTLIGGGCVCVRSTYVGFRRWNRALPGLNFVALLDGLHSGVSKGSPRVRGKYPDKAMNC